MSAITTEAMVDNVEERNRELVVQDLDPIDQDLLISLYKGKIPQHRARFGEGGYVLPVFYKANGNRIKNTEVRPDDTWVSTFPRSGTTWMQEMVWLLRNDLDYETALNIPLVDRYSLLIAHMACVPKIEIHQSLLNDPEAVSLEAILNSPSPRFIKTHLPLSLLPGNLLDTAKVVYVARDPRDVAVSKYFQDRLLKFLDYVGDFKTYWKLFTDDLINYSPYFSHLKEAWARRNHPNLLFIFYEELQKDLPSVIRRVAKFLDKEITSEQTQKLCEHLDIKNFRNNAAVNQAWRNKLDSKETEGFIRIGKSGGWRQHFDAEMAAQAQRWLDANLADTDLRFPTV